jgi:hypothetical protein
MSRELSEADLELFEELSAGALFDIINSVLNRRPGWEEEDRKTMICMIIRALAERYGVIEERV